jgi:pimeloyl-ACP methyl ester carboxylesterase
LHHTRSGEGEPLVLIHGLGGAHSVWDPILDTVTFEREAIGLDLPGFGHSPELPDRERPTPARLAVAVVELFRELGLERPHVAGISLGGWIALELAKLDEVASVAAFSPAGLWREPLGPRRFERHGIARAIAPLLGALLATRWGRTLLLRNTVAHPERVPPTAARELVMGWLDSPAYLATSREMRGAAFEHDGLVRARVTIAWAERDRVVGRPRPERMPPGARYLALRGCGHIPTWDDPGQVAGILLEASSSS